MTTRSAAKPKPRAKPKPPPAAKRDAADEPDAADDSDVEPPRLIAKPEVLWRTSATFCTIWMWMREGKFPRARQVGGKSFWLESEINDWIKSRPLRRYKGDPA